MQKASPCLSIEFPEVSVSSVEIRSEGVWA